MMAISFQGHKPGKVATMYNDMQAKREGWALFIVDDGRQVIQRLDDPRACGDDFPADPVFDCDDAAIAFVATLAKDGSTMHQAAMALHTPKYRHEFPDYSPADMPAMPDGFTDVSWHNDACPCFASDSIGLEIWVDFANPAEREFPECKRFAIFESGPDLQKGESVLGTDDWGEVLAFIIVRKSVLDTLAANGGAMLHWQAPNPVAFREALQSSLIKFDPVSDCYVHPLAVADGAGAWRMPS